MSLNSVFNSANSALQAQERVMATISENIANANTPGYTVEQTSLVPSTPIATPEGQIGTGVTVADTQRLRNSFLDDQFRTESGLSGQSDATQTLMNEVQGVLNEPSDSGLSSALSGFFDAFSSLSTNPSNTTDQQIAQQAGANLAQTFNGLSGSLDQVSQDAETQLQNNVNQANALLGQIQNLNQQIVAANGQGGAPALADQRDQAIDQLSTLVGVRTVDYGNGAVGVMAGSTLVADATQHVTLGVVSSGPGFGVGVNGSTSAADLGSGSLSAISTFTQTTLPGIKGQLDQLAAGVVSSVNTLSQSGTVTGSNPPVTGVPFFATTGTTAASIALSTQVAASPGNIVTGTTGSSGNGGIALQIAQLEQNPVATLGNQSIPNFYAGFVSTIGATAQSAQQAATAQSTLVSNLGTQRSAANGVNTDQQLVSMLQTQSAYVAAAHLITTANAMMQSLLQAVQG